MKKFLVTTLTIFLLVLVLHLECKNRIAPGYQQAYEAIKKATLVTKLTILHPELVNEYSLCLNALIAIGKGPKGLMILESVVMRDKSVWVSADNVYIIVKKWKIIRN